MIIRQQKSERDCKSFHVSAYKTKVLIIICSKVIILQRVCKTGGGKKR